MTRLPLCAAASALGIYGIQSYGEYTWDATAPSLLGQERLATVYFQKGEQPIRGDEVNSPIR